MTAANTDALDNIHLLCNDALRILRNDHLVISSSGVPHEKIAKVLCMKFIGEKTIWFDFRRDQIHLYGAPTSVAALAEVIQGGVLVDGKLLRVSVQQKMPTPYRIRLTGVGESRHADWAEALGAARMFREFRHGVLTMNIIAECSLLNDEAKRALLDNRLRNVIKAVNFCPKCISFLTSSPSKHVCRPSFPPQTSSTTSRTSTTSPTSPTHQTSSTSSTSPTLTTITTPATSATTPTAPATSATTTSTPSTEKSASSLEATSASASTNEQTSIDLINAQDAHNGHSVDTGTSSAASPQRDVNRNLPSPPSPFKKIRLRFKGLPQKAIRQFFMKTEHYSTVAGLDNQILWHFRGSELTIEGLKQYLDDFLRKYRSFSIDGRELHFSWVFP
eukprot:TRINITY_DN794_c0_g1_i4.p1 TRINITY_DN794_c0_g1~~TRINITY_DN794_c0_g1_i4.p1  ORF type:complete len:389 (-),score=42.49 TRINITY_DN794_c0_g1_i4:77-1243(-)